MARERGNGFTHHHHLTLTRSFFIRFLVNYPVVLFFLFDIRTTDKSLKTFTPNKTKKVENIRFKFNSIKHNF